MQKSIKHILCVCCALCGMLLLINGCAHHDKGFIENVVSTETPDESAIAVTSEKSHPERMAVMDQTEKKSEAAPYLEQTEKLLGDEIAAVFRKYGTVGAQVAVIQDGIVLKDYSFGFADQKNKIAVHTNTKFRCASLSKLITAMTAMAAQETDQLDIQKDIGEYLGYSVRNPRFPNKPITCAMLMTHTSSIVDSAAFLDSRNADSAVALETLLSKKSTYTAAEPGKQYSYSNFGVAVLADVVECATGRSFDSVATELLFKPMGIDASYMASNLQEPSFAADLYDSDGRLSWSVQRQMQETQSKKIGQTHHLYQGNLTISATDYARLLCVLLNNGKADQKSILHLESVQQIITPQYEAKDITQGFCTKRLNRVVQGRTMWCQTGVNYGAYTSFAMDPSDKSGVVVFTSGAKAKKDESELLDVCTEIIRLCYSKMIADCQMPSAMPDK